MTESPAVDDYLSELFVGTDAALEGALRASRAAGLPEIAVAPPQGKFLNLLARTIGARRILEVGTLGGYSAICLARALPSDGLLITCEIDPRHAEVARANLAAAGLAGVSDVRLGPAAETIQRLVDDRVEPFDLVFIDADKGSNPTYVRLAMSLVRVGSVIVVDNVVRGGRVLQAGSDDPSVVGTREVLALLADDPRLDATAIQTVGGKGWDGFAIALVTDGS